MQSYIPLLPDVIAEIVQDVNRYYQQSQDDKSDDGDDETVNALAGVVDSLACRFLFGFRGTKDPLLKVIVAVNI